MVNLDKLRALHLELTKKQSGGASNNKDFLEKFYSMKDGPSARNLARILPPKEDDGELFSMTAIHRVVSGVGPDGRDQFKNYHCRRVHNEECPLCDLYFSLWKEPYGREEHKTLARQIKPRKRYYYNVLDRNFEDPTDPKAVKVLSVGIQLHEKILAGFSDDDYGDYTDVKTGHDFKFVRASVQGYPNYDQSSLRPKSTPVGTDREIGIIMENLHNLEELVKLFDYEDVKECATALENSLKVSRDNSDLSDLGDDDDDYLDDVQA